MPRYVHLILGAPWEASSIMFVGLSSHFSLLSPRVLCRKLAVGGVPFKSLTLLTKLAKLKVRITESQSSCLQGLSQLVASGALAVMALQGSKLRLL